MKLISVAARISVFFRPRHNTKGQRRSALALRHTVKRVSLLLRRLQREQAHGRGERRRFAEQPRGDRDALGWYGEAGPSLAVGLALQERLVGSLGLFGESLAEGGAHGGELERRKLGRCRRRRDLQSHRRGRLRLGAGLRRRALTALAASGRGWRGLLL